MTAKVTKDEAIATITLSNPGALNTISLDGFGALKDIFLELHHDDEVRAIILTGEGNAFCAGAALDSFIKDGRLALTEPDLRRAFDENLNALLREMINIPKPIVCAINGTVAGGGNGLAFLGDVVLAAEGAKFYCGFVQMLNLVPDAGTSWLLPTLMGRNRALPHALLGDAISADDARDAGLVYRVVASGALMSEAALYARRLMKNPAEALVKTRQLFTEAGSTRFSDGLDAEREANCHFITTPETAEGVMAFLEKRAPDFVGAAQRKRGNNA